MKRLFLFVTFAVFILNSNAQSNRANIKSYKPGMQFTQSNQFEGSTDLGFTHFRFYEKSITFAGYPGTLSLRVSRITNKIIYTKWLSKEKFYSENKVKYIIQSFFSKYNIPENSESHNIGYSLSNANVSNSHEGLYCSGYWCNKEKNSSQAFQLIIEIKDNSATKKSERLWKDENNNKEKEDVDILDM